VLGFFVGIHSGSLLDCWARLRDVRQIGVSSSSLLQDGFEVHRTFWQLKTAEIINLAVARNRV
jgi:hypothetical protein